VRANRQTRDDWLAGRIRAELTQNEQNEIARGLALLERIAG
jgi:hypothetical protein